MELEIEKTEIVSANHIQVEVPNAVEILEGNKDYEVSVVKKEYTIIGDSIFIPSMYEDAPPWLKEFIDTTIEVAVTNRDQSLIDRMEAILTAMDYVPKNQYTEQINQIVGEDGIINSRIATLNSNLTDAINSTNATVAEINLTYASKDEAAAIANNVITASLSGSGEIGSALIQLQEAYATLESTTAQSISTLESVMEGEITGNATAMETIRTYVGIDEAGASTGTGLSAYLEASDGTIGGADSQLANDVRVTAEGVESKFAYNSIVNINGIYKKSGFGLSTNYTSGNGTKVDPYVSEFWIDASRFKFTNSNQTGQVTPFTIDATGDTPQITFNGVVNFTNTNTANGYPGTVKINGGMLEANTVTANQINTIGLIAENISASEIVGKTITGGVINGARINGAVIKASYLDLNGDLEVLTNYIITIAMYNANPSLYTDSVYIAADNQYRIPTLSIVREAESSVNNSYNGAIFKSLIRSYNCGISNSNLKAVKILPTVNVNNDTVICNVYNCKLLGNKYYSDYRSATVSIMVGNGVSPVSICIGRSSQSSSDDTSSWGSETVKLYINNANVFQTYDDWNSYGDPSTFPGHAGYFFSINGLAFKATVTSFNSFTVTLLAGSYVMQSNFNDINASLIQVTTIIGAEDPFWATKPNPVAIISTSSSIYINNMI